MCRSSFKGAQPLCQLFSKAPPLAGMVSASHTLDKLRQKDLMNCVLFLFRADLFYFNVELFYSEYFLILTIVPPLYAQSLYPEDVHEVKVKAGLAPPETLNLWQSNVQKLKSFCDTPGHSWDPYQAVACKKVVGCACCTTRRAVHPLLVCIV